MTTTFSLGSVSTGTLRTCDLVEAFIDALAECDAAMLASIQADYAALFNNHEHTWEEIEENEPKQMAYLVDALQEALEAAAPVGVYFGAHPGDGAVFGFWVHHDWRDEFPTNDDELKVDDTSDVPADFTGTVMHVSDHGNVTVYSCVDGTLTELWSCV